jgi:hypothetical protein
MEAMAREAKGENKSKGAARDEDARFRRRKHTHS